MIHTFDYTIRLKGLSLIELMVALVTGLLLTSAIGYLHISQHKSYIAANDLSNLQENVRFAAQNITYELRMAGYIGCAPATENALSTTINSPNYLNDFIHPIAGFEADNTAPGDNIDLDDDALLSSLSGDIDGTGSGEWEPSLPAFTTDTPIIAGEHGEAVYASSSSDALIIRHGLTQDFATVTAKITDGFTAPGIGTIAATYHFSSDDDAMYISNCDAAVVFQPNAVNTNNVTYNTLGKSFEAGSEIMLGKSVMFFVGASSQSDQPQLYARINSQPAVALASGIEMMQILYGEDTDSDGIANVYGTADAVNLDSIVSLRISLLARTEHMHKPKGLGAQTFDNIGQMSVTTEDDRKIHQLIELTIAIRNLQLVRT